MPSGERSIELREVPLFKSLQASERVMVEMCLKPKIFQKGEMLFAEGNSCNRIFIVKQGRIKIFRTSSNGREQILEILNPGDTCACNPGATVWCCSTSAQALTPAAVWFLSRDDYVNLVKTHTGMSHAINKLFADRLCRFSSLILEVSLHEVKKRLIRFLLDMSTENARGSEEVLRINFTREEIAQRIGSARETVVRQLHLLKKAKLIDIKPKQIVILDKEGLRLKLEV